MSCVSFKIKKRGKISGLPVTPLLFKIVRARGVNMWKMSLYFTWNRKTVGVIFNRSFCETHHDWKEMVIYGTTLAFNCPYTMINVSHFLGYFLNPHDPQPTPSTLRIRGGLSNYSNLLDLRILGELSNYLNPLDLWIRGGLSNYLHPLDLKIRGGSSNYLNPLDLRFRGGLNNYLDPMDLKKRGGLSNYSTSKIRGG